MNRSIMSVIQISKKATVLAAGFLFSALSATTSWSAPAQAEPATTEVSANVLQSDINYGELYLVQKKYMPEKLWMTTLQYAYGFSNPYVGIHGMQLNVGRQIGQFVRLSLQPGYYKTTDKDVAYNIAKELSSDRITVNAYKPQYDMFFNVGITPLTGLLSFFNSSTVHFDLVMGLGGGASKYSNSPSLNPAIRLFIMPEIMISDSIGITTGIQSTFERFSNGRATDGFDNRVDIAFGIVGRL